MHTHTNRVTCRTSEKYEWHVCVETSGSMMKTGVRDRQTCKDIGDKAEKTGTDIVANTK